jgi:hypothetical protein
LEQRTCSNTEDEKTIRVKQHAKLELSKRSTDMAIEHSIRRDLRREVTYMDSSSGWATTSITFRVLLSPRRGGMNCGLRGTQDGAAEEKILPREIAHRSTAPAARTIQIHAMGRKQDLGEGGREDERRRDEKKTGVLTARRGGVAQGGEGGDGSRSQIRRARGNAVAGQRRRRKWSWAWFGIGPWAVGNKGLYGLGECM